TYMVGDQRFAGKRPDVLTFRTEPLGNDVTLAGPIGVRLHVSSSGTDSDFDLKLIDELPDGTQQLVRGEPMRAKFRNSFSNPEPLQPNISTPLRFDMPDVHHTFVKGHRITVQVQSSWFPLTDRNPQTFTTIHSAPPQAFIKATQRIFHTPDQPSMLVLPVWTGQ
ncbi:MAG TPA: CocE/NonD family hydrolase, partial [Terriglobus sp.]